MANSRLLKLTGVLGSPNLPPPFALEALLIIGILVAGVLTWN